MRPTLHEIAATAELSVSTVSRALNGNPAISMVFRQPGYDPLKAAEFCGRHMAQALRQAGLRTSGSSEKA
jgi:DNA-binding LacI/PurR family transcriptional regulator